jgi:hypothetical protein
MNPKSKAAMVMEVSDGLIFFFMALFILMLRLFGNRYRDKKILGAIRRSQMVSTDSDRALHLAAICFTNES